MLSGAKENNEKVLLELLNDSQKKTDSDVKNTKTTKKMHEIDAFTAEPGIHSDYHKHIPPLNPIMTSFKVFMKNQQETKEALTI